MRIIIILLMCLLSGKSYSQLNAEFSFDKAKNRVTLTLRNSNAEYEVEINDNAGHVRPGSKLNFYYRKLNGKLNWWPMAWRGIGEQQSTITLKPLESCSFIYNSVVKYSTEEIYTSLIVNYDILYHYPNDTVYYRIEHLKGDKEFPLYR